MRDLDWSVGRAVGDHAFKFPLHDGSARGYIEAQVAKYAKALLAASPRVEVPRPGGMTDDQAQRFAETVGARASDAMFAIALDELAVHELCKALGPGVE